jgi:hypothetical protein
VADFVQLRVGWYGGTVLHNWVKVAGWCEGNVILIKRRKELKWTVVEE